MTDETFDLKELCRRSDVTPRTVHFYIQQGVLPPAVSRGPGARYNGDHLRRLRLIRRLQREHLPLAEIRQRLETMADDEVATALSESETRTPPPPGEAALDYVRGLLARSAEGPTTARTRSSTRGLGWRAAGRRAAADERDVVQAGLAASRPLGTSVDLLPTALHNRVTSAPPASERSQWDRIVLAPDVELHVRRPLTRDMNRRVDKLLDAAHDILKGD